MRVFSVCMLALFGFVAALPVEKEVAPLKTDVNTRNTPLELLILELIEGLREVMINGSGDIPVLDPLNVDQLYLPLDIVGFENSFIEAADAVVNGISQFVIDDFSFGLTSLIFQRYTLYIDGHIPAIDVTAKHYDLSVTALDFTIFGTGEVELKVVKPRVQATIVVSVSLLSASVSIYSADIKVGLDAFEPALTGIFHDDELNDFINLFLAELVPQIMEFFEEDISTIANTLVMTIGNQILENISITDFLPLNEIVELANANAAATSDNVM